MLSKVCAHKNTKECEEEQCWDREALIPLLPELSEDHSLGVRVGDLSSGVNRMELPCGLEGSFPSEGHGMCRGEIKGRKPE